ncbi:MAG: hypothetical protein Q7T32_06360, partial [Moraxellaceae bacterium]|nr:hypothetical protein [Moraxellaceae bacterium]
MTPYRNLHGNSNVVSYETTEDSIHVVFRSGTHRNYLYNHVRPGKTAVGFYPAFTDTSDKPHNGYGGVSWQQEEGSLRSTSKKLLSWPGPATRQR